MDNLRVYESKNKSFKQVQIVSQCVDVDNNTLYLLANDFNILKVSLKSDNNCDDSSIDISELICKDAVVVMMEYLVERSCIILAFETGQVAQVVVVKQPKIIKNLKSI